MLKKAFPWLRVDNKASEQKRVSICGKVVIIRDKSPEDLRDDYTWRTDEELSRLDATTPIAVEYQDFAKYLVDDMKHTNPRVQKFSIDTHSGKHIGNCMIYDIDLKRSEAELGIMIGDRNYWGKGYGTDSVNSILVHIFGTMSLNKVYLHTLEWNYRARRCFASAGFRETKNVTRNGLNFVRMEIARPQGL